MLRSLEGARMMGGVGVGGLEGLGRTWGREGIE